MCGWVHFQIKKINIDANYERITFLHSLNSSNTNYKDMSFFFKCRLKIVELVR